jgi:asparagine synthase (glutamine-hydrolysing)
MAHSLELRVPLVDAWLQREVASARFEPGRSQGKAAVVRSAAPELPAALFARPKSGFAVPVAEWLREQVGPKFQGGQASRYLALRVLEAFGVPLARTIR